MLTLSDLKAFLAERGRVTLTEISLHFDTPASAVVPMLDRWIAKGRLRKLALAGGCGKAGPGCSCSAPPSDIYEWIGP